MWLASSIAFLAVASWLFVQWMSGPQRTPPDQRPAYIQ
jgi:hypothetical protein